MKNFFVYLLMFLISLNLISLNLYSASNFRKIIGCASFCKEIDLIFRDITISDGDRNLNTISTIYEDSIQKFLKKFFPNKFYDEELKDFAKVFAITVIFELNGKEKVTLLDINKAKDDFTDILMQFKTNLFKKKKISEKEILYALQVMLDLGFEIYFSKITHDIKPGIEAILKELNPDIKDRIRFAARVRKYAEELSDIIHEHDRVLSTFFGQKPVSLRYMNSDLLIDFTQKVSVLSVSVGGFRDITAFDSVMQKNIYDLKHTLEDENIDLSNIIQGYGFDKSLPVIGSENLEVYIGADLYRDSVADIVKTTGIFYDEKGLRDFVRMPLMQKLHVIRDKLSGKVEDTGNGPIVGSIDSADVSGTHIIKCSIPRRSLHKYNKTITMPFGVRPEWIKEIIRRK